MDKPASYKWECEDCEFQTNSRSRIELHHLYYEARLTPDGKDVEPECGYTVWLCRDCHQARHDLYNWVYNWIGYYDEEQAEFEMAKNPDFFYK